MFLKNKQTGTLIKIQDTESLINPNQQEISGKDQAGQEEQNTATYNKQELVFPSGESLPRCWLDANYTRA
ncbi:acetyltransferase [[Phormidium ambiguum] IAM M-71]|uniref:Acetyltransferase n=1 Tax=[Phormidium ambiguum] IAM M-71 TaxID=454136 RepID=A0A1U7IQF5_9CYAN|nr:acetyltransferase [Phormidium ambiguum]OKH39667.1 acetyltransferase [Phormidium ambiguum IAM M-71]